MYIPCQTRILQRGEKGERRRMELARGRLLIFVLEAFLLHVHDVCSHGNLPRTFRYTVVELLPTMLAAVQVSCWVSEVMMSLIVRVPVEI